MPKTKPRKEKQLERDNRNQAKALQRQKEKEERVLAIKKQLELEEQLKKEVTQKKSSKKVLAEEMKDIEKKDESSQAKTGTDGLSDESLAKAQTKAIQAAKEDLKVEVKSTLQSKPARIIENHTTYVPELKAKLYKLASLIPGGSIQAGELIPTSNKAQFFSLEFQRTLERSNIYKFLACSESTKQEVIITVTDAEKYSPQFISNAIEDIEKANSHSTQINKHEDLAFSYYNRTIGKERQTLWKTQHKEQSVREKTQEKAEKKAQKIAQHGKKLASKVPKDQVQEYAKRDVDIIAGTSRTRYSKF